MSADGMMWSADAALSQAVLAALRADPVVQAIYGSPARIFDDETSEPAFPYAELERHEVEDRSSALTPGQSHTLTVTVRTRDDGRSAAKEAVGVLRAAFETMRLSIPGMHVVLVQPLYSDVLRTPDLRSFRGIIRIRIIVEGATP